MSGRRFLRVTYLDGVIEDFRDADSVSLMGQAGRVLEIRDGNYDKSQIACIPLTAMRKWEWVAA